MEFFYGTLLTDLKSFRSLMPHKIKVIKIIMNTLKKVDGIFLFYDLKNSRKIHAISDVENLSNFKKLNLQEIRHKF